MGRNAEDGGIPRAYDGESGDHYSNEGFKGLCLGIIIRTKIRKTLSVCGHL